jgi:hypothetical protein
MFELELFELLNQAKKVNDEYEINKVKNSISKLIKQNPEKYKLFIQKGEVNQETITFLEGCEDINLEESKVDKKEITNDFEIIKKYYSKWLNFYEENNKETNENCEQIVLEIINFYVLNRYDVLEKVFKIKDSEDFESFKNMIRNYLRKYYAEKIEVYMQSDEFERLSFFSKRKKKNQILNLMDDIGEYNFNQKNIGEVLS